MNDEWYFLANLKGLSHGGYLVLCEDNYDKVRRKFIKAFKRDLREEHPDEEWAQQLLSARAQDMLSEKSIKVTRFEQHWARKEREEPVVPVRSPLPGRKSQDVVDFMLDRVSPVLIHKRNQEEAEKWVEEGGRVAWLGSSSSYL